MATREVRVAGEDPGRLGGTHVMGVDAAHDAVTGPPVAQAHQDRVQRPGCEAGLGHSRAASRLPEYPGRPPVCADGLRERVTPEVWLYRLTVGNAYQG